MRTVQKALIVGALLGVSSPAVACEFHGGVFWTPSGSWQNFHPKVSLIEPIYLDEEDDEFAIDDINYQAPIQRAPKARPSFSEAASRASRTAKFRITGNTIETVVTSEQMTDDTEQAVEENKSETVQLEADAQTIR